MDTIVCDALGQLRLTQLCKPVRAKGAVLIRVQRGGICGIDMHMFRGTQPFLN